MMAINTFMAQCTLQKWYNNYAISYTELNFKHTDGFKQVD